MNIKHRVALIMSVFLIMVIVLSAKPIYLLAKAKVAQHLLLQAWHRQQKSNQQSYKPWPWADTYPVAKLTLLNSTQPINWIILAGLSGRNMAFAPAWLEDSAAPNRIGNTVISGHNDSHFRELENIAIGDKLLLEDTLKQQVHYTVSDINIVDSSVTWPYQLSDNTQLTLITCYPFSTTNDQKQQRLIISALAW